MESKEVTKKMETLEKRMSLVEKMLYQMITPPLKRGKIFGISKQTQKAILRETSGVLRGKKSADPIKWQRKIRKEWGRKS